MTAFLMDPFDEGAASLKRLPISLADVLGVDAHAGMNHGAKLLEVFIRCRRPVDEQAVVVGV